MSYPSNYRILMHRFSVSKIHILLPISIIIFIISLHFYTEAGKHLTPYSVHVRGYYRRDGTYVSSHYRRPPGSVAHDAPYESTRNVCKTFFFY
ncbi:MAG: hypothetical protein KAW87_02410 [Candidatus Cloacimonetes bacterium]|nr:hypothetical protein [Candidatus Cloacimonadota bacterium]